MAKRKTKKDKVMVLKGRGTWRDLWFVKYQGHIVGTAVGHETKADATKYAKHWAKRLKTKVGFGIDTLIG